MAEKNRQFIEHSILNKGLITRVEPDNIPDGAASSLLNIDIDGVGFGPRKGRTVLGDIPSVTGGAVGLFNYRRGDGVERLIWVNDDTANSKATMRVYDSDNAVWEVLEDNLFESKTWTFAPFNESWDERIYMCNGYDDILKWNGATTLINGALSGAETTITVDDTDSFTESGTLVLEGTKVTYTGRTGTTFTGCSGTPAASDNVMIMQAITNTATTIDTMEATTGWGSVGGGTDVTIATDAVNYKEGTKSLQFTVDASGDTEVIKTITSIDLSSKKIRFWHRCDIVGSAVRLTLGDGTNTNYYNFTTHNTASTWALITIDPTNATANSGTAATLTAITKIGFDSLDASKNYWIDFIRYGNLPAKILLEHNAKLFKAGHVEAPTLLEYSVTGSPENFSTTTGVTAAGAEDFPEGGGEITALQSRDDELLIFKQDIVKRYKLVINDVNDALIPFLETVVRGPNIGATNALSVIGGDNEIYYASKRDGLRSLSQTRQSNTQSITLTQITKNIRPTIEDFDFSQSACVFWENKAIMSCMDSGSSKNDVAIVHNTIEDNVTVYRGWNIGMFAIYGNTLYMADSVSPGVFKLYDGATDNGGSIASEWTSKREFWGVRFKKKAIPLVAIMGLIGEGTTLTITIKYDDGGITGSVSGTITGSIDNEYVFAQGTNTFGEDLYGEGVFGGNKSDSELNTFRIFCTLPLAFSPYNVEISFSSNGTGQRWKILSYAFLPSEREEIPDNLKIALTQ